VVRQPDHLHRLDDGSVALVSIPVVAGDSGGQATRTEARDFSKWIQLTTKPARSHWRSADKPLAAKPRMTNPVTGKSSPGSSYAPSTIAHCETVLRSFYAYHLDAGTGPLMNPFPLARARRAHAHHNPMERFERQRVGLYRPRQPQRIPRQIPDAVLNELFAQLSSDRDRALVAFWVSTGARASELLGGAARRGRSRTTADHRGTQGILGVAAPASVT
jgi:site-specific recombinase XerC